MKLFKLAALFSGLLLSSVVSAQAPDFSFQDIYGKQHQFDVFEGGGEL